MLNQVTDAEPVLVFRALWFARGFESEATEIAVWRCVSMTFARFWIRI